jgi:dienelactone hydrolase
MTEIVLFHHGQGLTTGVVAFADRLRAAGHTVHLPDVYEGHTFPKLEDGIAYLSSIGGQKLTEDAIAQAEQLPSAVVYIGFSLGVMAAQQLAQTRPGALAAVLVGSAVPASAFGDQGWPSGVPLQIHSMDADPIFVGEGDIEAAHELVATAGAELFLYPGDGHMFIDSSLDETDPAATDLVIERTLALLERV